MRPIADQSYAYAHPMEQINLVTEQLRQQCAKPKLQIVSVLAAQRLCVLAAEARYKERIAPYEAQCHALGVVLVSQNHRLSVRFVGRKCWRD